jgi:hypothetical protein
MKQMALKRSGANCSFVHEIESESGLGCLWKQGLVFQELGGKLY